MLLTFILLGLSICAVWIPNIALGHGFSVPLWALLLAAATASGLASGALGWIAVIALTLLIAASVLSQRLESRISRTTFTIVAALIALALALHRVPGFNNPTVIDGVRLTESASPFTQYANFDKGAAGLILLVFFCQRVTSMQDRRRIAAPTLMAMGLTALAVIACALVARYVAFDPKLPTFALTFLAINLLFTCVAEEAFFRGLLQERLTRALAPRWQWIAIGVSAVLFALAHFAGGMLYVALATIAGLGYALVYGATRRIESAVLTHFAVNAIHFFGFTYPHLAR